MMSDDGLASFPPSIRGFIHQDPTPNPNSNPSKRKRNLPGTPDPEAEVMALSPKSLMATNRFLCEVCNKGFQRDQNLQLHRRGHNLPWKLKQRNTKEAIRKKVYICPEKTCVHHDPSRALGDLTGIKKHYSRKHGEKKWKCEKCSKKYAVQSDWKAHSKICGTREYKCDCGTLFSRKDSFITHRAFCDALVEESTRFNTSNNINPVASSANLSFRNQELINGGNSQFSGMFGGMESDGSIPRHQLNIDLLQKSPPRFPIWLDNANRGLPDELVQMAAAPPQNQWFGGSGDNICSSNNNNASSSSAVMMMKGEEESKNKGNLSEAIYYSNETNNNIPQPQPPSAPMSATALLQKAAQMGSTRSGGGGSAVFSSGFGLMSSSSFPSNNLGNFGSTSANLNQNKQNEVVVHHQHQINTGKPEKSLSKTLMADNSASDYQDKNGLTRDFLGVGGKENRQRFLQENDELAKFASAMDMSHYSRNH